MKLFKKIAGILLLVLAVAAVLFEALTIYVQLDIWNKYGDFPQGLDALIILSVIILAVAAVCGYFGTRLTFKKKEKQELGFAQQEAAAEKPQTAAVIQKQEDTDVTAGELFSSHIGYLLLSAAIVILLVFLIIYLFNLIVFSRSFVPLIVKNSIAVIASLAAGIAWSLLYCNINIVVNYSGIHFHRNGKNYLNIGLFNIESCESSTVIYGFIPIVMRNIKYTKGNKYKRITCHCFSKKDFDAMIDEINQKRREIAAAAKAQAEAQK